jgi:hypothetical protein
MTLGISDAALTATGDGVRYGVGTFLPRLDLATDDGVTWVETTLGVPAPGDGPVAAYRYVRCDGVDTLIVAQPDGAPAGAVALAYDRFNCYGTPTPACGDETLAAFGATLIERDGCDGLTCGVVYRYVGCQLSAMTLDVLFPRGGLPHAALTWRGHAYQLVGLAPTATRALPAAAATPAFNCDPRPTPPDADAWEYRRADGDTAAFELPRPYFATPTDVPHLGVVRAAVHVAPPQLGGRAAAAPGGETRYRASAAGTVVVGVTPAPSRWAHAR